MIYFWLNLFFGKPLGHFVKRTDFFFVLSESHRFLLYKNRFIDSSFSKDVLLNRSVNDNIVDIVLHMLSMRFPSFRGYNSNHSELFSIFFFSFGDKLKEIFELVVCWSKDRAFTNLILSYKYAIKKKNAYPGGKLKMNFLPFASSI